MDSDDLHACCCTWSAEHCSSIAGQGNGEGKRLKAGRLEGGGGERRLDDQNRKPQLACDWANWIGPQAKLALMRASIIEHAPNQKPVEHESRRLPADVTTHPIRSGEYHFNFLPHAN